MTIIEERSYPMTYGDIPPGDGYVRMEMGKGLGNLPEGFHTGGPFYHPRRPHVIYKPLDARPNANSTYRRFDTDEDKGLAAGIGLYGFIKNWDVVEQNGRRWLVRNRAWPVCEPGRNADLTRDELHQLELGLRTFNDRGWEIGDIYLPVLRDAATYEPFFCDLSCTMHRGDAKGIYAANDSDRWLRTLKEWGYTMLYSDRMAGMGCWAEQERSITFQETIEEGTPHIYLSYNRPFSFMWADKTDNGTLITYELIQRHDINAKNVYGHTWVCTTVPLTADYCKRYELRWCWSPWRKPEGWAHPWLGGV